MVDRNLQRAQRAAGVAEDAVRRATMPLRNFGFPYRAPTVPRGVEVPPEVSGLGAHYDTEWARRPASSVGAHGDRRGTGPSRGSRARVARDRRHRPTRRSRALEDPPPVIFAPNHHSHLDTGLMIRSVPSAWRHRLVVAAAADYFFDKKWKAALVGAVAQRHPDRPRTHRAQVVRPDQGPRRRRLQPRDLPGGRPFTRRLGPGLQGWRGIPVRPYRSPCRARVHRRNRRDLRQGNEAPEAGTYEGRLRSADAFRAGRVDTSIQRTDRSRRHDARRRSDHRLLDGTPTCRRRNQPDAHRARSHRMATRLGPRRSAQARHGGATATSATSLARPRMSSCAAVTHSLVS